MQTTDITIKDRKYMSDLHFDHELWMKNLAFFKDELIIFQNRLEELVQRNSHTDVTARVEQFQNQFIRQKEVIDELLHELKGAEQSLVQYAKDHPVAVDHQYFHDHVELREKMSRFQDIWNELKQDFMRFAGVWM